MIFVFNWVIFRFQPLIFRGWNRRALVFPPTYSPPRLNLLHGSRVLARIAAHGGLFARELQLVALLQTCAQFGPWHTRLQDHLDNTVRVVSGLTGAWAAENSKVAGRDRFVCFVFKDFMFASVENCLCRSRLLYWPADRGWIFLGEHDGCQLSKLPSFHPLVV